jgi:SAM-dependent methyltransferase
LLAGLGMLIIGRGYARLAVDLASVSDADRVVDIGCGPGSAVRAAAQRGASVVGVDPAPLMLRLAGAVTGDQSNITWSQGSAEKLPLASGWATARKINAPWLDPPLKLSTRMLHGYLPSGPTITMLLL